MKLDTIRSKIQHGVPPLTQDEVRWLWEQATGEQIEKRIRCHKCHGAGAVPPIYARWGEHTCQVCGGSGYTTGERAPNPR